MEKLKLGIFDLFVYILPGFFILISLYLIVNESQDLVELFLLKMLDINLLQIALVLVICFLLGFINQYLSYEHFKFMSKLIWKKRIENKETSIGKLEEKIVLIRHFSPNNFNTLNTWLALRGMCYSLYQAILLLEIILLIRSIKESFWTSQRITILITLLITLILFLRRAITFHEWTHETIEQSFNKIEEFK
jgi:hypothetical protein